MENVTQDQKVDILLQEVWKLMKEVKGLKDSFLNDTCPKCEYCHHCKRSKYDFKSMFEVIDSIDDSKNDLEKRNSVDPNYMDEVDQEIHGASTESIEE